MDLDYQISDSGAYSPSLLPSLSPPPKRPNRWTGPPSTYLSLIEQERGLSISLDQIRNQDLSIHLYNAHALKRRARVFWERKGRAEEFDEVGEGMGWSPPKGWTAWPLGPDSVPREGETVGEGYGDEEFTFRRRDGGEWGSGLLEEHLVAVTLKFARERFERREEARSSEEMDTVDGSNDDEMRVKAGTEELGHVPGNDIWAREKDSLEKVMDDFEGEETAELLVKEPSEQVQSRTYLKPVISQDDERSAEVLRPSIHDTLSKLDEVLMALHHARETCHQIGSRSAANTDDETARREDSASPAKRPRGRPRKFANLALLPKDSDSNSPPESSSAGLFRAKKTHRGRPQKVYDRLEDETQQEYLVRIARMQKKPLPFFAAPQPVTPSRSRFAVLEKSRKSPVKRATSEELKILRQKKLELRDWSQVLGSAALVGFPPDVVARATQRCADLFGEEMTMMTLVEAPFSEKDKDFMTTYRPEEIADFSTEGEGSSEDSDKSEIKTSRSTSRSRKRKSAELEDKSWFCPIDDCRRQNQGFAYIHGLRRHLEKFHKMEESDIDEVLDDTQEMDGAVHIDGFLKPMRQKRGIRGNDKGPRKRGRWTGKVASDVEDHGEEESRESSSSELGDERSDGDSRDRSDS